MALLDFQQKSKEEEKKGKGKEEQTWSRHL